MKPINTHGAISWAELQTSDPKAAAAFYSALFEWETQTMEMDFGLYTVGSVGGQPTAGIMKLMAEGNLVNWGLYVTVDDVDATLSQAAEAGATIIQEGFDAPAVGRMGVFQDPFGAAISVIKYNDPDHEAHQREWANCFTTHGVFSWFDLRVADAEAASAFYGDLFGWTTQKTEMPQGAYYIINVGEEGIGGMVSVSADEMPPHWGAYVTVRDLDAYIELAESSGGKLLFPLVQIPDVGRFAAISDPQGGVLAGFEYIIPDQS